MKRAIHLSVCLRACLYLAAGGLLPCVRAAGGGWSGMAAAEVNICKYDADGTVPIFQVRADRLFIDHERRGFFRIGLLPMLVAENVQIQIGSAGSLTNVWSTLHPWNTRGKDSRCVELRGLEISLIGSGGTRLTAAVAQPKRDGTWELSSVTVLEGAKQIISVPQARLQVSGPAAGRLVWTLDGPPQEFCLFTANNPKKP